jgi:uncharacterized membrane protein
MKFIKNALGNLLAGLAFWLPVWVITFILWFIFGNIEELGRKLLSFFISEEFIYPGLGIVLGLIVFLITGIVLKKTRIGDLLSRIPVIGIFFRKMGGETITPDRLLHLSPCLFLYSPTCPSYGWILSEERVEINGRKAGFELINVYYPNVPTLLTGQIFPVRKKTVIKLGNPSREIIDLLLYTFRSPEYIRYLPWEDESEDEFKKRAESFGLKMGADI